MESAVVLVTTLLMAVVPGRAVRLLLRLRPDRDPITRLYLDFALGLATWPVLFLFADLFHIPWSRATVVILAVLSGAAAASAAVRRRGAGGSTEWAFAALALLTLVSRLIQARHLVLPAWVDSVHHTAIVRLILEHGAIPSTYEPFFRGSFVYHWGWHAFTASICQLLGKTDGFAVARVVLVSGQMLNAAAILAIYAAGKLAFGSRRAGLVAAAIGALYSYFPAYYVSWGRYTHLAGVLLVPAVIILLIRSGSVRRRIEHVAAAVLVLAGLLLIHIRLAFFAATLALVLAIYFATRGRVRTIGRWAMVALAAAIVVSPWYVQVARSVMAQRIVRPTSAQWETPNGVPDDLLWAPHNKELATVASGGLFALAPTPQPAALRVAGIAWWLALVIAVELSTRRRRFRRFPLIPLLLLAAWVIVTAALINLPYRIAPNSAAIITLFLPMSAAAGGLLAWLAGRWSMIVMAVIALYGFATTRDVVNPSTVLANEADMKQLRWIATQTPRDAVFAVRGQPWIGGAWVGVDGGYWIPVLTDRRTNLPPALYQWSAPPEDAARVNEQTMAITSGTIPPGFTHVYQR